MITHIHQALLGLGVLAAIAAAITALFWRSIEWRLLCWLQRRRTERERLGARIGIRRSR